MKGRGKAFFIILAIFSALFFISDVSQAAITPECPNGYTYNSTNSKCEMNPFCENGWYNPTTNRCYANVTIICPGSYSYDSTLDTCTASSSCDGGTMSADHRWCYADTVPCTDPCPEGFTGCWYTGTCDPEHQYCCMKGASCPAPYGGWQKLADNTYICVNAPTRSCPTGYIYDGNLKLCWTGGVSACPTPGALDTTLNKCLANPYPITPINAADVNNTCEVRVGLPVSIASGVVYVNETDFTINGIMPIVFTRYHNSKTAQTLIRSFGRTWAHNFDIKLELYATNIYRITDPDGSITYYLDQNGDKTYEADIPKGETSKLIKNTDNTLKRIYKDGSSEEFSTTRYLTAIVDKNGNRLTLTRDTANKLTKITDPSGREINITYNTSNYISQITLPDTSTITYTYVSNTLQKVTYPDGTYKTYEYSTYKLTGIKNEKGNYIEKHTYDSQGRGITSSADGTNDLLTLNYINDTQTTVTDSLGRVTTYTYDKTKGKGHLISRTGPGCQSCGQGNVAYTYDDKLNVTTETDALGNVTAYTYDANGNTLTKTEASGTALQRTTTYTYNSQNDLIEQTDPIGTKTQYQYDAKRNLIKIQTLNSNLEILTQTALTRDTKGQITQVIDNLNNTTNIAYDTYGNITSTTDALNNTTTYTYDIMGKPLTATDANGKTTTLTYDQRARLIQTKDSLNNITAYTYDQAGSLTALTDAKTNTTSFTYDLIGRLINQTDPMAKQTTYTYDTQGNLTSKTDPNGNTIQYTYDDLNRLIQKTYPDASTTTYQYDAIGNLTSASNQYISYTFVYDALGRMTSVSDSLGKSISYVYDANSNRTSMTSPIGTTSYVYNALNQLTQLVQGTQTFGFTYDSLGRRTSLSMPNGTTTSYSYDSLSRLLQIQTRNSNLEILNNNTYTYDSVGNKLTKQDSTGTHNYSYDNTYQLINATHPTIPTEAFSYDQVGNRTNTTVDAANKLLQDPNASYQYDANGNRYIKTQSDGTVVYYSYDYEGRLTRVETQKPGLTTIAVYKYDALGRRIEKNVDGVITRYLYDGLNIIAEMDVNNNITKTYTHNLAIDDPLAITTNGQTYYYHKDALGTITSLTDSTGTIVQKYEYDSFGNITSTQNPSFIQPFTFTGREYDKETGMYYYNARYYDQKTGTFISKDPIGFIGGDVNLYRYVENDPINWVDPEGLVKIKAGGKIYEYHATDHHGVNPPEIHLHNKETGQKVGAETGKIYDPKGKTVCGKISKKDLSKLQGKLKKLGYLGMIITAYGVYDSITADDAKALENLLDILEQIPANRREKMFKEIIENNPDKFKEVKPQ